MIIWNGLKQNHGIDDVEVYILYKNSYPIKFRIQLNINDKRGTMEFLFFNKINLKPN